MADADARGGFNAARGEAVLGEGESGAGEGKVEAVVSGAGDGHGLAEASGAGGEQARTGIGRKVAAAGHGGESGDGFEGADEDAAGFAVRLAGDIEAVIHAIDEVNVGMAGRAEEDSIAGGFSGEGVGGRVVGAEVGFDFDDAADRGFVGGVI